MGTTRLSARVPLGQTGIRVPPIIYGTSYLGNLYRELSIKEKMELMKQWFLCTEKPVVIDTAGKYGAGLALEVIGKGLEKLGVSGEEVIISNKLGWYRVPLVGKEPTFEPGAWVGLQHDCEQRFGYREMIRCFEQGTGLLGGGYVPKLVSVHDPDEYLHEAGSREERDRRLFAILESYRALFDLKEEGRVKAVGIGAKDWAVIRELYTHVPFDWVMFANSFTIFHHPREIVEFMDQLAEKGVGIINSALFHGGFLTGGTRFNYREVDPTTGQGKMLYGWRDSFHRICRSLGVEPWHACLLFGLSHPAVCSIALNTSKPDQMERNAEAISRDVPSPFWDKMKSMKLIDPEYRYLD